MELLSAHEHSGGFGTPRKGYRDTLGGCEGGEIQSWSYLWELISTSDWVDLPLMTVAPGKGKI